MKVIENPNKNSNSGHYIELAYSHKGVDYFIKKDSTTHNYYCSKVYEDGTGHVVQEKDFYKKLPKEIYDEITKAMI